MSYEISLFTDPFLVIHYRFSTIRNFAKMTVRPKKQTNKKDYFPTKHVQGHFFETN